MSSGIDIVELAQQLAGGGDERMKLISQLLASRKQADEREGEEELSSERRKDEQALRFLRRLNSELARAAGACVCWGKRPTCSICRGAGRAGFHAPDERLFLAYFGPLLRQLGMLRDEHDIHSGDPG